VARALRPYRQAGDVVADVVEREEAEDVYIGGGLITLLLIIILLIILL